MGSPFETATWNGVTGAYYMGVNSSWEVIWLVASVAMCVVALWVGHKHENDAYNKAEK